MATKKASDIVSDQVIDFGFIKNTPAPKVKEAIEPTVVGKYDKENHVFWLGFKQEESRDGVSTKILLESKGIAYTTLRVPNDKGEIVNAFISPFRLMVKMSDSWKKARLAEMKKDKGE